MKLQNYDNTTLGIIKGSEILESSDFQVIEELKEELKDVFLHSQVFRTRTEMEISVLNEVKHPTPDSKYWQSVREQNVMFQELVSLSYDYRKNLVEIKKLRRKLETEDDDLEQELLKIEIERKEFTSKNQERVAKDRIREIKAWHEIKEKLIPDMKHGTLDVNDHQLESYNERYKREVAIVQGSGSPSEQINLNSLLLSSEQEMRKRNG